MNLAKVLELNDLNRNTYNTLARRNGFSFMEMEIDEGGGRDKFSAAHALVLGCFLSLQQKGLNGRIAADVLSERQIFLGIWELLEVMATGQPRRTTSAGTPVIPGYWLKIGVAGDPPQLIGWALDDAENSASTRSWLAESDAVYAINVRRIAIELSKREQQLADMKLQDADAPAPEGSA